MNRDVVTQEMIDRLDLTIKEYYMKNAIYKSRLNERSHTRFAYEQEVRGVCLNCPECKCCLDSSTDDDVLPVCDRFERHFKIIVQLAAAIGLRVDPAADGELDTFIEFCR